MFAIDVRWMFNYIQQLLDIHIDYLLHIEDNVMHFYFHSVFVDGNLHVVEREFEFFSIPLYQIEELKIEINLLF